MSAKGNQVLVVIEKDLGQYLWSMTRKLGFCDSTNCEIVMKNIRYTFYALRKANFVWCDQVAREGEEKIYWSKRLINNPFLFPLF